jgi:hypothetical protein
MLAGGNVVAGSAVVVVAAGTVVLVTGTEVVVSGADVLVVVLSTATCPLPLVSRITGTASRATASTAAANTRAGRGLDRVG